MYCTCIARLKLKIYMYYIITLFAATECNYIHSCSMYNSIYMYIIIYIHIYDLYRLIIPIALI